LACIAGATGAAVARGDGDGVECERCVDGYDPEATAAALAGLSDVATATTSATAAA
jgi:hypothetical protein